MTKFKRDKRYDGTILHGLHNTASPAFKAKQNKPLIRNKGRNAKNALESNIHQDKPSANIPRHKIAEQIWNRCTISNMRSTNGL